MTTEKPISRILRNLFRHSSNYPTDGGYYHEVDLPVTLDEAELIPEPTPEVPLHERIYEELDERRKNLYNSEALLVATINKRHEELASTRMAINSVEAAMVTLKTAPIVPEKIERYNPRLAALAADKSQ